MLAALALAASFAEPPPRYHACSSYSRSALTIHMLSSPPSLPSGLSQASLTLLSSPNLPRAPQGCALATSRQRGRPTLLRRVPSGSARCRDPRALSLPTEDAVPVLLAAALAGAAGYLQYSVSSGEKGLNAFLMKEKKDNPFYSDSFKAQKPSAPAWFAVRLPSLDFVEVYGQTRNGVTRGEVANTDLSGLYLELDDAIEREDYNLAMQIKARIDGDESSNLGAPGSR
ncbi:hypothetical protein AB1Y20_001127 [Prymnesium parvum]|uniref:Uncharacterized protein n=1 Tax=Prymnesium parvum TaxID=97485 RepID=A0AB34KA00_PRYPA